jgi:hypothetical protein
VEPRASRISLPPREDVAVEIWMGGTDSFFGEPMTLDGVEGAHIIDLVGDLPEPFRQRAWRYTPRVFMDAEMVPFSYPRLTSLVHEIASAVISDAGERPPGPEQTLRIYILCQYGMNRSGLLTGLLLRALGENAESAVGLIRASRPGALSNQTFVSLIEQWTCPEDATA